MPTDQNPHLYLTETGWLGPPYLRRVMLREIYGSTPTLDDARQVRLILQAYVGAPVVVDATGTTPLPDGWLYAAANHIPYAQIQWIGLTQTDQAALAYVALTGPKTTSS